ncbi:hypothetical protein PIIN_10840 [Serendipita indica DSM 11827]|uniref:Uncharacterized protein n=1 Tax=Serendipita indica (strain DSM 11827) TaxID=1109443 RepID=G4TZW2_SERID|nr:hypothetical protein PIIN_10840 [Serendipita indica DSM 11827]
MLLAIHGNKIVFAYIHFELNSKTTLDNPSSRPRDERLPLYVRSPLTS